RVGAQASDGDRARRGHHAHRPRRAHGQRRLEHVDDLPARSDQRIRSGDLVERKTEDVETTPAESGAKSAAKSGKSAKSGAQSGVKSGKSTKSTVSQPQLGFWGMCRWAWTQLTTMRVALILLLVLALAAIPGSLLPQRIQDPGRVNTFLENNGAWGRFLDAIQMFDVYSLVLISSNYLLLMVSLIGGIIPRTKQHWKAMRSVPPKAPRRLGRMPGYASFTSAQGEARSREAADEAFLDAA